MATNNRVCLCINTYVYPFLVSLGCCEKVISRESDLNKQYLYLIVLDIDNSKVSVASHPMRIDFFACGLLFLGVCPHTVDGVMEYRPPWDLINSQGPHLYKHT